MASQNITLFAYLNIDNPMVAWEVAIGRIRSACDNTNDNFGVSIWQFGLLRHYSQAGPDGRFINELHLEAVRQRHFPRQVSRLKGVYFFESLADANAATERWGIQSKQKYITEVAFSANNITRVDSEWITSYLRSSDQSWIYNYWKGDVLGEKPLTEVLASGLGIIHDPIIRSAAYQKILDIWPYSTLLLAAACFGFNRLGLETIAQTVPALVARDGEIVGTHYINMAELDDNEAEIASLLAEAKDLGELPPIVRPPDTDSIFHVPDMGNLDFTLRAGDELPLFRLIHSNFGNV